MSVLELQDVSVQIENNNSVKTILSDINLSFDKKKIYVITGPNGGGKSTLGKCIMGINENNGKILFDGKDISKESITDRGKLGIGYAFQTPPKFKGITVNKYLTFAKNGSTKSIPKILKAVGLDPIDYSFRKIDSGFSGGELKRIEIASLMVRDLNVAIFDEPEAGIDLWSFKRLIRTFLNLKESTNTCIIIISHQERIMQIADEIIVLENGKIKEKTSHKLFLDNFEQNERCCHKTDCYLLKGEDDE